MIWGILMCVAAFIISYNIMIHLGFMAWLLITAVIFVGGFIVKTALGK